MQELSTELREKQEQIRQELDKVVSRFRTQSLDPSARQRKHKSLPVVMANVTSVLMSCDALSLPSPFHLACGERSGEITNILCDDEVARTGRCSAGEPPA